MIIALFVFFGAWAAIERDINYGLPNHIRAKSMGVINFLYVFSRFIALDLLFLGFINTKLFIYGIGLYLFAYTLKKIARSLAYGI